MLNQQAYYCSDCHQPLDEKARRAFYNKKSFGPIKNTHDSFLSYALATGAGDDIRWILAILSIRRSCQKKHTACVVRL